jgi:hypothetical protein
MKVVIQSNAHPSVLSREFENIGVFGSVQSNLEDMDSFEALTAENGRRTRCEALIQQ